MKSSPNHFCDCEIGGDCTKTTMCHVQLVEQDLQDEIERLSAENREYVKALRSAQKFANAVGPADALLASVRRILWKALPASAPTDHD